MRVSPELRSLIRDLVEGREIELGDVQLRSVDCGDDEEIVAIWWPAGRDPISASKTGDFHHERLPISPFHQRGSSRKTAEIIARWVAGWQPPRIAPSAPRFRRFSRCAGRSA